MWMSKVVYLTGAPASGKSSTTRLLLERVPNLLVWEYGARLTAHVIARSTDVSTQDDLRARSATVVTPRDVDEVDDMLIAFVAEHRASHPVIIDSHPVTKEAYGYRITPFSLERFEQLAPDEIWVLYASPEETRRRIGADNGGRPMVTEEEARTHTALQASVAATYGMSLGRPVYLFDTAAPRAELVDRLVERLS
jgi:adenylate kinase